MNCSVTLTAEEFKNLHNALWRLGTLQDPRVEEQVSIIRDALAGAYQQELEDSDRRYAHYNGVREKLGMNAIWSMYEVDDLEAKHDFSGVSWLVYREHSGKCSVWREITGDTWLDLYRAADLAMADSEDQHHVFIEHFSRQGTMELDGRPELVLELHTGS